MVLEIIFSDTLLRQNNVNMHGLGVQACYVQLFSSPYGLNGGLRMSVVGKSQLTFLSLVGNFFLVLSVVSNIF